MTYPITPIVTIDFSNGATFGYSLIMNDPAHGIIGTNVLADNASYIVDVSDQTIKASLQGGYNLLQDQFQVGTAKFRIVDPNGDFNPQNTSSPYYGKLIPLRKIRMSAVHNNITYYLFSGYITAYNYTYPKNQDIGYVDIEASDAFRLFYMANISTVTGGTAGQTTGQRINSILDAVSFPQSMRTIDTGDTTVQADPGGVRSSLSALKIVEFTEQGAFFVDATGNANFISRSNLQKKSNATPTYFSNAGDGIGYWNLVFANDDKLVINSATVTPVGLAAQTYTDAASVTTYFPHSYNVNNILSQTTADALNIARTYVATRKDTTIRIDAMTLDLTTPNYSAGIVAALDADYFNMVKIRNDAQSGTTITKTLEVVGIAHEITPNSWKTTLTTSEPIVDAFIIGNATFGIISVSVMTY